MTKPRGCTVPNLHADSFERGLLGVVLLDNKRMPLIATLIEPHHFGPSLTSASSGRC